MNERALRFRIGLFVLLAMILLAVLIVLFGSSGSLRWFRSNATYTIDFEEAAGVTSGTPVRLSGVRIGEVSDVQLARKDEKDVVRVVISVEKRYEIRHDQKPTLSSALIGGDAVIDFIAQKKEPRDRTPWPVGSIIPGEVAATVGSLVTRASEVVPTTQDLMNDIRKSLQNLEKLSPTIEATMKEFHELARESRTVIPDVKKTNTQVQDFIQSVQRVVPDVQLTAQEVRKLATTLNEAAPDVKDATKELDKLVKSLNETFPEFRKTNLEVQKFIASLNDSVPDLRKTNKDVQELIKQATDVVPEVKTVVRDTGATVQQFNKLGENLDKLVRDNQVKLGRIVDNVNASLDRVLDLLSNENRRNITDTIRNLRLSSDQLPETSKNLNDTLKEGKETAKRLRDTMAKADEALASLRDLTKLLSDRGPSVIKNLDEVLDKLNKLVGDGRELMRVIGNSDGTISRLLTDPALYNHLDDVACMVGKTIPRLDRILKDFETFADKLARHPESIGLGGVVKPGSGLKDPPDPYPGHVIPPGR